MKVKVEMELADLLRISVLLDHHRSEAADHVADHEKESPVRQLWQSWGLEAAQLNEKLLKAIDTSKVSK
jgi:hypothetical protein